MFTRIEAPAEMPVTLEEIRAHCVVDISDDDALLEALVAAAYSQAEHRTGRALLPQVWTLECSAGAIAKSHAIPLRHDTTDVLSVTWIDSAGKQQEWPSSNYRLQGRYRLVPVSGWPDTGGAPMTITFRCGRFPTVATLPQDIKAWIKLHAATLYANREAVQGGQQVALPRSFVDGLLDPTC